MLKWSSVVRYGFIWANLERMLHLCVERWVSVSMYAYNHLLVHIVVDQHPGEYHTYLPILIIVLC